MRSLSGLDASFLYLETPAQPMHIVTTVLLDPKAGRGFHLDRLVATLEARLHLLPPFRRRLAWVPFDLAHPVWIEDPDFDLEQHVFRASVRSPGGLRELAEVVGDIAGRPLDRSRPLWELHLVDGLGDGRVGFVTKVHQCAIDSTTGADLIANLFDLSPDTPVIEPPPGAWTPDPIPSDVELVAHALRRLAGRPSGLVKVARHTASWLASVVQQRTSGSASDSPTAAPTPPRTPWTSPITAHRVVAFGRAPLEDVRRIKTAFDTTVNDVILALCTDALRAYLAAHDDLPDGPLVCSVPVSVRGPGEQDGTNQLSSVRVCLPVHLEDPAAQLAAIGRDTAAANEMQRAIGAELLQDFSQFAPPTLFNRAMRLYSGLNLGERHRPAHNLVVSNVPGPPIPLYIAGARVEGIFPFGPLFEGSGLNLTVVSNTGQVDFGVIGCRETLVDPWMVSAAFETAVGRFLDAAKRHAEPDEPPRREAPQAAPRPRPRRRRTATARRSSSPAPELSDP